MPRESTTTMLTHMFAKEQIMRSPVQKGPFSPCVIVWLRLREVAQGLSYGIFHFIGLSDLTVINLFSFVDSKKYLFYGCTVAVLVHSQLAPVVKKLKNDIH